nr:unnamed protein product [Digitaria exilis]
MEEVGVEVPLPREKLSLRPNRDGGNRGDVVLVANGSFNPPTYMHLRMFELAKDELQQRGYRVLGGYMSPVNDAYKKKDLLPAAHRIRFCELACKSSSFVMVDPWEAMQKGYQRTLTVLSRIRNSLCKDGLDDQGSLKVMLLCGSDLLESFSTPGVWIPDQLHFGFPGGSTYFDGTYFCFQDNIISVDEIVPNQISSSRVRDCIKRCLSIKYLTCDEVIEYIRDHKLFMEAEGGYL